MKHLCSIVAFTCFLFIQLAPHSAKAQSNGNALEPGHYIVVAAYKLGQDSYAQRYMERINRDGLQARYGKDEARKYLYVYLDYFTDYDESIREMLNARKKEGFSQAWVRVMKGDISTNVNLLTQSTPTTATQPEVASSESADAMVEAPVEPLDPPATEVQPSTAETTTEEKGGEEDTDDKAPESVEESPVTEPVAVSEASVLLSLFNATNHEPIEGEVEVVDTDRSRMITKVKGNEYVKLPDPKSSSGRLTLLANVFGYRPVQHEINFQTIPADTMQHYVEWAGNHYVIKFDLTRYHKGDIQTLYNVYFYNDAAIMLPESKYQLNQLLEMMKENEHYKILLHGHTNGNARGRLITMGPSKQFFALSDDVKDGTGSAKELSKERATVIKEWLVSQGVAPERMEIKAWGGGRMLHDKNSVNAKRNVRVDVEIIEED